MLLSAAASIVTLGLAVWVIGHYFSYTGVALIGAVLILAAGSGIALTDLEQPAGQTVVKDYDERNLSASNGSDLVNNRSVYRTTTRTISMTDQFGPLFGQLGLGGLLMLLSATLSAQSLQERGP